MMDDLINHPPHYTVGSMETIEIIEAIVSKMDDPFQGYLVSNIVKYLCRFPHKENSIQDLEKAKWFLDYLINTLSKK